ncbi:MAG: hypothetical protein ABW005_10340 [Burkholderiaceae bacterium]
MKSAVESALVAALVGAACLWFLISTVTASDDFSVAKVVLLGLGVSVSLFAHWAFMAVALRRDGRRLLPWLLGLVIFFPITSVVALVLMSSREPERQTPAA